MRGGRSQLTGWKAVGAAIVFQALVCGTAIYSFTFFAVPWGQTFTIERDSVMVASFVMSVVSGLLGPLVGRLLVVLAVRTVVGIGLALFALGMVSAAAASDFWMIVAAYGLLIGPGLVLAGPLAAQVLVTQTLPASRRAFAFGCVLTGTSLGGIIFPPIVAALIDLVGWRSTLIFVGPVAAALIFPLVWLLGPRQALEPPSQLPRSADAAVPSGETLRELASSVHFWAPLLAITPALMAFVAVQFNLDPFARSLGIAPSVTAGLMSVVAGSMIGSKLLCGYLADRWDPRLLCSIFLAIAASGLFLLSQSSGPRDVALGCVLLGVSTGSFLPLLSAMFVNHFGSAMFGRALGLALPFLALAGVGGLVGGWLHGFMDGYAGVFGSLAAIVIAGGIGMAVLCMTTRSIRYAVSD